MLMLAMLLLGPAPPPPPTPMAALVVGEGLKEPFGVDFDAAGNMYVVEMAGNRVSVLDSKGVLRVPLDRPHGALERPGTGALYVSDSENHRVIRIDSGPKHGLR